MKPETAPDSADESNRCIMLVDDSCIQARIFSEQAGYLQYTVKVVRTEDQALTLLREQNVPVIFIELHLLLNNGFAVGQSVMAQSQVPCVLLTGMLKNTDREWARQLGFAAVLERPLARNDLQNVLEHARPSEAERA